MNLINYSSLLYNSNLRFTAKNSNFVNSFSSMISKNKTAASTSALFSNGVINNINFNNTNKSSSINSNTYSNYFKNKVSDTSNNNNNIVKNSSNIKNYTTLEAKNNILTLNNGENYKVTTKSGEQASFKCEYGSIYGTDDCGEISTSAYKESDKLWRFVSDLAEDETGLCARVLHTQKEVKDMLSSVGIEAGFFEIKSGSKTNEFYVNDDGFLFPKYQVDSERKAFNDTNWFTDEEGYTKDSKFIIEGKEYKLDDTGHLHIPDNVACVMENVKIIK